MHDDAPDPPPAYRGRFAPTPSGPLHLGSLVAAVGSYLCARAAGGAWLVRIDDLDPPRVVPGAADDILRTLEAFGMQWHGEVVYQSRRSDAYRAALARLTEDGHVFGCACSRKEIAAAGLRGIEGYVYPGTCRNGLPAGREARAWRLRVDDASVTFDDAIQGRVTQNVGADIGDFVLHRIDGVYAYHLAVVVDDADAGITHVVRGSDLIDSTPRQILLQRLLGLPEPAYAHLPVVRDAEGNKLSKQTYASPVRRDDPAPALAAALRHLGLSLPASLDRAPPDDMLKWAEARWDINRVPREPGRAPSPTRQTDRTA